MKIKNNTIIYGDTYIFSILYIKHKKNKLNIIVFNYDNLNNFYQEERIAFDDSDSLYQKLFKINNNQDSLLYILEYQSNIVDHQGTFIFNKKNMQKINKYCK
jgi:hypothetical protein